MNPSVRTLLVDNGSLEPAAVRGLRALATALSEKLGVTVEPVSLLHSSAVPVEQLDGRVAEILEPALKRRLAEGVSEFAVLPLFFGPSRALTEYIPERVAHLRETFPELRVRVAAPLHAVGDDRLARMVADAVRAEMAEDFLRGEKPRVALVDHGSPARGVTAVRDEVAAQLARLLDDSVAGVAACSMERRPGPEYAFNDPLLASLLASSPWNAGPVIVAQLFLLPGRHAGPDGDIAQICRAAEVASGGALRTRRTGLLAAPPQPLLLDVLADRWRAL